MKNDDLLEMLIDKAEIEDGYSSKHVLARSRNPIPMINLTIAERGSRTTTEWTHEEDEFLRNNLGFMSESEMARKLGRTVTGVHLRWFRDLLLTSPSKHPDWISAETASEMLGVDCHKVAHWCDQGLIPYRLLPSRRKIRLIHRTAFDRWVISTPNWIYFDHTKIADPRLRRLCELRAKRWGDEWWTTKQAAEYHGVSSKDVLRLILRREIPGVQLQASKGGRHPDAGWLYWYVRKSDAVKAVFVRRGMNQKFEFTARGAAWVRKAKLELNLSCAEINRSMGSKRSDEVIRNAIKRLLEG